jgi:hypothetical protein
MILATRTGPRSHHQQRIAHQGGRPRTSGETTPPCKREDMLELWNETATGCRDAPYLGGVWSSPAAGPGRGREFRWDLRVLTLSSWNRRRRGARGNPGSHHAIDAELGRAPEEAGSFIPPRTRCCSNHHQSSSQPVTADAEGRLLLLGSGSVRARSRRPPAGDDGREVCGLRVAG